MGTTDRRIRFKLLLCIYVNPIGVKTKMAFGSKEKAIDYAYNTIFQCFKDVAEKTFGKWDRLQDFSDRNDKSDKPKTYRYWALEYGEYPAERIIMKTIEVTYVSPEAVRKCYCINN